MSDPKPCIDHKGEECCELADYHDDCECQCCRETREAEKDREFDERTALGYGV